MSALEVVVRVEINCNILLVSSLLMLWLPLLVLSIFLLVLLFYCMVTGYVRGFSQHSSFCAAYWTRLSLWEFIGELTLTCCLVPLQPPALENLHQPTRQQAIRLRAPTSCRPQLQPQLRATLCFWSSRLPQICMERTRSQQPAAPALVMYRSVGLDCKNILMTIPQVVTRVVSKVRNDHQWRIWGFLALCLPGARSYFHYCMNCG